MVGDISTGRAANRHPLDWYVEEGWEWDQVVAEIGMADELAEDVILWDPCAGYGHMGLSLESHGFAGRIILSDLVQNVKWEDFSVRPLFFPLDFLTAKRAPADKVSIFFNPPYSYRDAILEACCRQALRLATHRVVALAPLKWLAGGKRRGRFFRDDFPPQTILYFTQRPSMPPGDRILQLGNRAYRGGVIDYCALVWDVRNPTAPKDTRSIWLPRLDEVQ